MRRYPRLLAIIAVLALAVAACPADDPDDVADPPDVDPIDDTDFPDLTGQSVEVAALWTGSEEENFRQVLTAFEEETGASVTYTSTGDEIAAVLGTRIEGGQPPDVALLPQPGLLNDFAQQGSLVSIEDVVGDLVDTYYADVWRDLGTVDGTLYGVWFKAANKSTVWYNVPLFDDAGVDVPSTWDEALAVSDSFVDFGIAPWAVGGADGWTLTDWFENIYLQQAGPELYDQLTDYDIPWTHDSVIEALETFAEVVGNPDYMAGEPLNVGFGDSVSLVFRDDPDAAMVYEGDFVAGVIGADTPSEVGVDADFFPFPAIAGVEPGSHIMGAGDIAVLMDDTEGGRALIRWLATPQAAEIWASAGGFLSPNEGVDTGVYPDDTTRALAEQLVGAEVFRFDLSDLQPAAFGATPGAGMWGLLQDFLRSPDDVEGIAQRLDDAAEDAFGRSAGGG